MSHIPIGWLIKNEGFETTPLTTGFYDHRWYTKHYQLPAQTYFYQKDMKLVNIPWSSQYHPHTTWLKHPMVREKKTRRHGFQAADGEALGVALYNRPGLFFFGSAVSGRWAVSP
jgi:hypothetical protein